MRCPHDHCPKDGPCLNQAPPTADRRREYKPLTYDQQRKRIAELEAELYDMKPLAKPKIKPPRPLTVREPLTSDNTCSSKLVDAKATIATQHATIEELRGARFDFEVHLQRQRAWSCRTFGPGIRLGVLDHIRKELDEVAEDPTDLTEWIDVVLLAIDGAWRAGHEPSAIIAALAAKQAENERREWPDWRTLPSDKAIEHKRRGAK